MTTLTERPDASPAGVGFRTAAARVKAWAEEMPDAYKDINQVVDAVHGAGISKKVAKLRPICVIKG